MSDISDCIIKILADNGVSVEQTDIWKDNGLVRNVKSIIELNFSAHDKVFEDKIAKLEEELKEWKAEAREIKKNRDEQLKSFRKAVEPYIDIGHMHETIAELKQRIAELESKNEQLKHDIDKMAESKSKWIDRAVEWQQKCEKLESGETSELPFDPLECANYLINATYERETNSLERGLKGLPEKVNSDRYTIDDLEQIAEHLLVYCKHNKESE